MDWTIYYEIVLQNDLTIDVYVTQNFFKVISV